MTAVPPHHPKYRTKLCRNYTNGNCPFGQKCSFLHPAPETVPLSSSLAQHLFNWNMFLPQLLPPSNKEETLKTMPQWSPPRLQGPQLIDEGPSPPTSLLLSTSDCTSSEHMPQTKRFNRRRRVPCRHFIRTRGWCPAGAKCRFLHDVTALPSADGEKVEDAFQFQTDMHRDSGRTISGGVLMSIQLPSPATISQEHSEPRRYTEAEPAQPCQPMYWPSYTWQPYHQYYAAGPTTAAVPVGTSIARSPVMQYGTYHPQSQPSGQTVLPTETQTSLPLGTYEVNGTTYFPTQAPSALVPPPVTCSIPVYPNLFSHMMASVYSYCAPPPLASSCHDIPSQVMDARPQTSFDPFYSDPMIHTELPVIPRLEDYQISPIQQEDLPCLSSSPFTLTRGVGLTDAADEPKVAQDQEFPYQPPKNQQVGHARRISIIVKKTRSHQ